MTSIQPIQSCTRSQRSMRRCKGWLPRSLVMWSLSDKSFLQRLMKPIRLLEHLDLRTISWLRIPRSLKRSCSKLELNWRGLQVQSLIRCSIFRNLLLIEQIQGMVSLLLILLLLVLLFLFLLVIMLKLRTMMLKLIQLVRTQTRVNLSQEHPLSKIRKKLKTLGLRRLTLKSLNKRSSISVIIVELPIILNQIAINGQPLNRAMA